MGKIVVVMVTMAAGVWETKLGEKEIIEKWSDIGIPLPQVWTNSSSLRGVKEKSRNKEENVW